MAQLATSAKVALRHLEATFVRNLDSSIVHDLFSRDLLTSVEKEKIDAGQSNADKNSAMMTALRRKEPVEVLKALIEILEGEDGADKQANSYLLKKIAAEYPAYSFESGLSKHPSETEAIVSPISLLPATQHPGMSYPPAGCLELSSITSSSSRETTDTGSSNSYRMSSTPRGYCVIINNMNFTNMKDRPGSNWDAQALQNVFGNYLGFHVEPFKDLSSKEICTLMQNLQAKDHSKLDCLVVAILSHGENGNVYGTDGVMVSVERITSYFSGTQCPSLIGKPKVFIMQACRGKKFDYGANFVATDGPDDDPEELENIVMKEDETDGGGYAMALPEEADFILAYATTPGYVSWRNSAFGTWFIKALTDVLHEQAHQEDFLSMLTEVNRKVAEEFESRGKNKQMPAPVTMLRYKLYFYPTRK